MNQSVYRRSQWKYYRSVALMAAILPFTLAGSGCRRHREPITIVAHQKGDAKKANSSVRNANSGVEIIGDEEIILPMKQDPAVQWKYFDYAVRIPSVEFKDQDGDGTITPADLEKNLSIIVSRASDRSVIKRMIFNANTPQADVEHWRDEIRKIDATLDMMSSRFDRLKGNPELADAEYDALKQAAAAAQSQFSDSMTSLTLSQTERFSFPEYAKKVGAFQAVNDLRRRVGAAQGKVREAERDKSAGVDHKASFEKSKRELTAEKERLEALPADDPERVKHLGKVIADLRKTDTALAHNATSLAKVDGRLASSQAKLTAALQAAELAGYSDDKGTTVALAKAYHTALKDVQTHLAERGAEYLERFAEMGKPLDTAIRAGLDLMRAEERRDRVARDLAFIQQFDGLKAGETQRKERLKTLIDEIEAEYGKGKYTDDNIAAARYKNPDTVTVRVFARDLIDTVGEEFEIRVARANANEEPTVFPVKVLQGIVKTKVFLMPETQTGALYGRAFAKNFFALRIEVANDGDYPVVIYGDSIEPPVSFSFTRLVPPRDLRGYIEELGPRWSFSPAESALNVLAYMSAENGTTVTACRKRVDEEKELLAAANERVFSIRREIELRNTSNPEDAIERVVSPLKFNTGYNDRYEDRGTLGLGGARTNGAVSGPATNRRDLNLAVAASGVALPLPAPPVMDIQINPIAIAEFQRNLPRADQLVTEDAYAEYASTQLGVESTKKPEAKQRIKQYIGEGGEGRQLYLQAKEEASATASAQSGMSQKDELLENLREELVEAQLQLYRREADLARAWRAWDQTIDETLTYNLNGAWLGRPANVIHEIGGNYQLWTADDVLRVFQGLEQTRPLTWQRRLLTFAGGIVGGTAALSTNLAYLQGAGLATGLFIPGTVNLLQSDVATHLANLQEQSFKRVEEIKSGDSITRFGFIPRGQIEGLIGNDRLTPLRRLNWFEKDYAFFCRNAEQSSVPGRMKVQIQDIHSEEDILIRGYVIFATGTLGSKAKKSE